MRCTAAERHKGHVLLLSVHTIDNPPIEPKRSDHSSGRRWTYTKKCDLSGTFFGAEPQQMTIKPSAAGTVLLGHSFTATAATACKCQLSRTTC